MIIGRYAIKDNGKWKVDEWHRIYNV
jgi:hypothetical protein